MQATQAWGLQFRSPELVKMSGVVACLWIQYLGRETGTVRASWLARPTILISSRSNGETPPQRIRWRETGKSPNINAWTSHTCSRVHRHLHTKVCIQTDEQVCLHTETCTTETSQLYNVRKLEVGVMQTFTQICKNTSMESRVSGVGIKACACKAFIFKCAMDSI